MILLFGNSDDVLMAAVSRRLRARGVDASSVSEPDLFSAVPFAFEQRGPCFGGSLRLEGRDIDFSDLSGLFVRLPRVWWPADFDLQDGVFVYHESNAAWFALLAGLRCPMVNRPALSAWVQDLTYPETLARRLADRLTLPVAAPPPPVPGLGRLLPTRPPAASGTISLYAVDGWLIPRSPADRQLADRLAGSALREWQRESDIRLCRLDFERCDHALKLTQVEAFPLLDEEPAEVVDEVAAAVAEVLA